MCLLEKKLIKISFIFKSDLQPMVDWEAQIPAKVEADKWPKAMNRGYLNVSFFFKLTEAVSNQYKGTQAELNPAKAIFMQNLSPAYYGDYTRYTKINDSNLPIPIPTIIRPISSNSFPLAKHIITDPAVNNILAKRITGFRPNLSKI